MSNASAAAHRNWWRLNTLSLSGRQHTLRGGPPILRLLLPQLLLLLVVAVRGARTTTTTTGGAASDLGGGNPSPPLAPSPWVVELVGRQWQGFVQSLPAPFQSPHLSSPSSDGAPTDRMVRGDTFVRMVRGDTFVHPKGDVGGGTEEVRELGSGNSGTRSPNHNGDGAGDGNEEGSTIGVNEIINDDDENNHNDTSTDDNRETPLSRHWPSPMHPLPFLQAFRGDRFCRTVGSGDPLAQNHPHNNCPQRRPGCVDLDLAGSAIRAGWPSLAWTKRRPLPFHPEVHGNRSVAPSRRFDPPFPAIEASVQLDPASAVRLAQVTGTALVCFGTVLLGTLRLLAPLIVARRGLNWLGDVVTDWYRGHYLRTTYQRMEHQYYRYYQGPAVFRSLGRLVSQLALLFALGRVMEWMVGLSHAPCVLTDSGGCHWWCGALWLVAVVGTGHAGAAAIALWGGPLRIQIRADRHGTTTAAHAGTETSAPPRRPSARHVFARPWRLLQWMRDPDQWIRAMAASQRFPGPFANDLSRHNDEPLRPFRPDPLLFPATWEPLRALHLLGLAREMTTPCPDRMRAIMRRALIQHAFADEWYRVLLCERRIAIGMLAMVGYLVSALSVFWTAATARPATASGPTALLLLPHLASIVVSAYVNVFVYHDLRRATKKQRTQSNPTAAVQGPPSAAADFWLQGKFVVKSVQW